MVVLLKYTCCRQRRPLDRSSSETHNTALIWISDIGLLQNMNNGNIWYNTENYNSNQKIK